MNINGKEHYLEFARTGSNLETKGYPQVVKDKQKNYLFKFLTDMLTKDLLGAPKKELYIDLLKFKDDFITYKLPIEYYREIDEGTFPFVSPTTVYGSPNLVEEDGISLTEVDYRVNLQFILTVINLILST